MLLLPAGSSSSRLFFLALVEDVVTVAAAAAAADWLRESLDSCWIGVAILVPVGSCTETCASSEEGLEEEGVPLRAGMSIEEEEVEAPPLLVFERLAGTEIGCWVYTDACCLSLNTVGLLIS